MYTEKDFVDWDKLEKRVDKDGYETYIDPDTGNDVECQICYIHEKAFERLEAIQENNQYQSDRIVPLCPKCNMPLIDYSEGGYSYAVVGETNYPSEDGKNKIGLYNLYHCKSCGIDYAMMPEPVSYNGGHDIFYTGGRDYTTDEEVHKLAEDIFEYIKPAMHQYINRKLNPKNAIDERLSDWNINLWVSRDVEEAICNFLYEKGYRR